MEEKMNSNLIDSLLAENEESDIPDVDESELTKLEAIPLTICQFAIDTSIIDWDEMTMQDLIASKDAFIKGRFNLIMTPDRDDELKNLTLEMNHRGDGMSDEQFEEIKKKIEEFKKDVDEMRDLIESITRTGQQLFQAIGCDIDYQIRDSITDREKALLIATDAIAVYDWFITKLDHQNIINDMTKIINEQKEEMTKVIDGQRDTITRLMNESESKPIIGVDMSHVIDADDHTTSGLIEEN